MYKKLLLFISIFIFTIFLSGCAKYSTNIEITPKDEIILTQTNLVDIDLYKKIDQEYESDNPYKNWDKYSDKKTEDGYKDKGFKVRNIVSEKYIGKEFSKKFKNARFFFSDSLPLGYSITTTDSQLPIIVNKGSFRTYYSIHLKFSPKELEEVSKKIYKNNKKLLPPAEPQNESNNETKEYPISTEEQQSENTNNQYDQSNIITELTIKIPKEVNVVKHNASAVDSEINMYIWKLSETKEFKNKQDIDIILEYKTTNYVNVAILILIILVSLIITIKNRKFAKKPEDEIREAF